MPIYEYLCGECGHELEALQKISEDPLVFCPECGEKSLKKKVSAIAFRLKGTGWYETDFKDSGKKKPEDKGKGKDKDKKPAGKDEKGSTDGADSATGGKDTKGGKETSKSKGTESGGKSSSSHASD